MAARMRHGIMIGAAGALAAGLLAAYAVVSLGLVPANADAPPPSWEKWAAGRSLDAALLSGAPKGPNPLALDDANLLAGIKLYAANCAVCHGAADGKPSKVALGLYRKAPQLSRYGVEDDDEGETFWKLRHGVRMTGMPAFGGALTDAQLWQITLFLKNMDSLPPGPQKAWEAVPSAARERG